jgi:serine/threonine-protein kinase
LTTRSRAQVKIADFGLAGLDDSIEGAEARAGTPAYMAPEQWAGQEVTVKSDLYALGMLLYELFTGEQPYKGKTPAEIVQAQEQSTPTTPSSLVEGFDPAVERVILTCLEKDPAQRPQSALAVAAALPGGDPLAAALAAGETPSPELVAQAGGAESVEPRMAIGLFVAALVLAALWVITARQTQHVGYVDLPKSPEVLVARAQEILSDLGYQEVPGDSVFDFQPNMAYRRHIGSTDVDSDRWDRLRGSQPAALRFRYRQSPQAIVREGAASIGAWMEDPAMTVAGEAMLELDPDGRLLSPTGCRSSPQPGWTLQSSSPRNRPGYRRSMPTAGLPGSGRIRMRRTSRFGSRRPHSRAVPLRCVCSSPGIGPG